MAKEALASEQREKMGDIEDLNTSRNIEENHEEESVLTPNDTEVNSFERINTKRNVPRAALNFMEVKNIVAVSIGENGRRCYKVHWKDSWIYGESLIGCEELIEKFWNEQQKTKSTLDIPLKKSTLKRDGKGQLKDDISSILQEKDLSKENTSNASSCEIDGAWLLDGERSDEEFKDSNEEWEVSPRQKKIKPIGTSYVLTCHLCNEGFELVSAFKRHYVNEHPGVKPFACDMCNKRFDRKENLSRHIRIHTNDRRYVCNYCGKGYTDPSGLKKHVIAKHTGMRFNCEICSISFRSKEVLNRHLTKHFSSKDHLKKPESELNGENSISMVGREETQTDDLLEHNASDNNSIVLIAPDIVTPRIQDSSNGTQADEEELNVDIKPKSLQNVVNQLQQFVNSGGSQVVELVDISSNHADSIQQTPTIVEEETLEVKLTTNDDTAKSFITHHVTPQQIISINTNPQQLPTLSAQQVLPLTSTHQIITVPMATSMTATAFVYTGTIVSPAPNNESANIVNNQ